MPPKLSQRVAQKLNAIARKVGNGYVDVGFLEGAKYSDGTQVALVAFLNEFGHAGLFPAPPRPFFRPMIAAEKPTWPKKMAGLMKASNYDSTIVLRAMGDDIEGALVQSIVKTPVAPLSHTTLVLRHRFGNQPERIKFQDVLSAQRAPASEEATGTQAKPLIWTGHMERSTGYIVKK